MKWSKHISEWVSRPVVPAIGMTKGMFESIKELDPGQVMRFTTRDGSEFVLLPADDFDHIAALAGLGFKPSVEKSKS